MVVVLDCSLFELNSSNPMMLKVRFQTSSASDFARGVEYFRRDGLSGRAGMVSLADASTKCGCWSIGYRLGSLGDLQGLSAAVEVVQEVS
jgi:hypothetical protein